MRIALAAIVAVLVLAAPAQAKAAERPAKSAFQDICGCVVEFTNDYVRRKITRTRVDHQMRGIATITPKKRRKTKRAIYDWQKNRTFETPFCKRSELHRKACKAAAACLGAAGTYIYTAPSDEKKARKMRNAAFACGSAAAVAWVS